jgi:hypothetical protein
MTTQKLTELLAKVTPGEWTAYNSENGRIFKHWRVNAGTFNEVCRVSDSPRDLYDSELLSLAPALAKHVIALAEALEKIEADSAAPWIQSIARNALNTLKG